MRRKLLILAMCLAGTACTQKSEMDIFIDDLMGQMTVEEKIGQFNLPHDGDIITGPDRNPLAVESIQNGEVGGLFGLKGLDRLRELQRIAVEESRLGIPMIFGADVIHGYETVFPIPLASSCSWNLEAIENSARISAIESTAAGLCWTFSPMVDIARDPRWGRIAEGAGEDPFLGSRIAEAMVRGYQGPDKDSQFSRPDQMMACVKHFALYGASEAGRDYNTVDMSRIRMYNDYLPPYKAAADAGAGSFMASFNDIDGVPATANRWLLTDLLRNEWGFDGFVVSDYTAIKEMVAHGIGDIETVSCRALNAGLDMDMNSRGFLEHLTVGLEKGLVTMDEIDTACRRMLEAKYKLGLFEDPYKFLNNGNPDDVLYCQEHRDAARKLAAESFVLLKNENDLLPLEKKGKIALIGPLADNVVNLNGTWSVTADNEKNKSVRDALEEAVAGKAEILYAKGSNLVYDEDYENRAYWRGGYDFGRDDRTDIQLRNEALAVARRSDVIIAALGESAEMSGENSGRTDISMPDAQADLLKALVATGKPVVLLLFNGRPLILDWESKNVPAILDVWFGGSETGDAVADVVFGDVNPSGKVTASFPRNVGQIPVYYSIRNTGRPLPADEDYSKYASSYLDSRIDALYPFGYGLSYTSYSYGDVKLSRQEVKAGESLTAEVEVTNTGKRAGKEVVQMYIRDVVGTTTRPLRELKGFSKISLEPGETKTVKFEITPELMSHYNYDLEFVAEPGEFIVYIGPDSTTGNSASFTLK